VDLGAALAGDGAHVGVPQAIELLEFAEAMLDDDRERQARARAAVHDALGAEALVDAAAIVASFNAVVKIADGTGIPLEDEKAAATETLRESLGLDRLDKNRAPGDLA